MSATRDAIGVYATERSWDGRTKAAWDREGRTWIVTDEEAAEIEERAKARREGKP